MSLTCAMDWPYYDDDCSYYIDFPKETTEYKKWRGTRCASCKAMIRYGNECGAISRSRPIRTWVEEKIYYETVPLANHYWREDCANRGMPLVELGYWFDHTDDMKKLVAEYNQMRQEPDYEGCK